MTREDLAMDTFYLKALIGRLFYPEESCFDRVCHRLFLGMENRESCRCRTNSASLCFSDYRSASHSRLFADSNSRDESRSCPDPEKMARGGIRNIVVLHDIPGVVELWKNVPDSTLTISPGYCGMEQLDVALGNNMPQHPIVVDTKGRDTEEQAALLRSSLEGQTFALVTWAGHMPRALMIFRRLNMRPVPAPMEFANSRNPGPLLFGPVQKVCF